MKSIKLFALIGITLLNGVIVNAQETKKETIAVAGNCGMCKSNIEKAAKTAGASEAEWDATAKTLTVSYASASEGSAKIQQAVAAAGYDTRDYRATDAAYNKLHGCCKYDRAKQVKNSAGCEMKDGKCVGESACIEKGCCKSAAECKEKGCCKSNAHADGAVCTKDCKHEAGKIVDAKAGNTKSCCSASH